MDRSLDKDSIAKLAANGFAVTKDGTVWINKSHVDSGELIDFNTLTQHEISHIVFGEDSEYEAQYVEAAYREFLTQVAQNGYIRNGEGITDYENTMLTLQEIARLNGYTDEEMQKFINGFMEGLIGKEKWRAAKDKAQAFVKRVPIVGKATSRILTKVSQADRQIKDREGKNVGIGVRKGKISTKNPVKSVKYIAKSFSVTKKEKNNKGTTKVLKAAKQYERFDDELDADEKDNVLDNIIMQNNENERKGGYSYSSKLFTQKRITDFINDPTRKATLIEKDENEKFSTKVFQISSGIYKEIWELKPGESYKIYDDNINPERITKEYEIYNKISLNSGIDAMTLIDKKTREVRIIYQGSVPAIHERAINPESWDRDWSNNLFGNTPMMADLLNAPSKLLSVPVNVVGKGIRNIGEPISRNPLVIGTGTVPSGLEGFFGNYTTIPTDELGKGIVSAGDTIINASGYIGSVSYTEYYKSDEAGTPKQYVDGYNYSVQMEKELQKKIQ